MDAQAVCWDARGHEVVVGVGDDVEDARGGLGVAVKEAVAVAALDGEDGVGRFRAEFKVLMNSQRKKKRQKERACFSSGVYFTSLRDADAEEEDAADATGESTRRAAIFSRRARSDAVSGVAGVSWERKRSIPRGGVPCGEGGAWQRLGDGRDFEGDSVSLPL